MPIYEPKGPAREYAALALNYYKGCGHKCEYCYVPGFFKMLGSEVSNDNLGIVGSSKQTTEQKISTFLRKLQRVAPKFANSPNRVLLSFTSDPYQPLESDLSLTRRVLQILGDNKVPTTVLTKNPKLALDRDSDIFKQYNIELASTVVFLDDEKRKKWEPFACSMPDRIAALKSYHNDGFKTWVSIEPIIDTIEAIEVIKTLAGHTGLLKIGVIDPRWNPEEHEAINWSELLTTILDLVIKLKQPYYIKDGLWKYATPEIKFKYEKEMKEIQHEPNTISDAIK